MAATRRRRALRITRRAEMSSGIDPAGMSASITNAAPPATIERCGGDDDGLGDEPGEERATPRPERLEHAVEGQAFDGEEHEEQRHHHGRDGDGRANDLVERRALLAHTGDVVDRFGDRQRDWTATPDCIVDLGGGLGRHRRQR